ncbi:hypothetical protein L1987_01153 [Smallanthus sonchifolius]|uniref:Uncharacterized protein n=1 Tax=Smallanthus sonchifolius TaxID=185202 RepID=A0ACB9K4H4_9ASTR|nr:hypothetical protein L1987_01153 [Smallanthus sonchifolius]
MEQEVNIEEQENRGDDDLGDHSHNDGTNSSFQGEETSSGRSKKRKRTRQVNSLSRDFHDAVVLFAESLKETSADAFRAFKMTYLTQLERFWAIEMIKNDKVKTFWSLGEGEREAWVRFLLSE